MSVMTAVMDQFEAALTGAAPVVSRVRVRALSASVSSAVCFRPLRFDVVETALAAGMPITWRGAVEVECYARVPAGSAPDVAVDALASDVFARVMTAGIAIDAGPQSIAYDFDVDGESTVCATFVFQVLARSAGATL